MKFTFTFTVTVECTPDKEPEVSPLRKVEVSEAVIPMSNNIIQCLKVEEGQPVNAESVFVRAPAVEVADDYKPKYTVKYIKNQISPLVNSWVVYDMHPKLAYYAEKGTRIRIVKKVNDGEVVAERFKGIKPAPDYSCYMQFLREEGYKMPDKYLPKIPNAKEIQGAVSDFLIPDIAGLVAGFISTPTLAEIEKAHIKKTLTTDLKIGDIIQYKNGLHPEQQTIHFGRIERFTKKRFFWTKELVFEDCRLTNGKNQVIYKPSSTKDWGRQGRHSKTEKYHYKLDYDGDFKVPRKY